MDITDHAVPAAEVLLRVLNLPDGADPPPGHLASARSLLFPGLAVERLRWYEGWLHHSDLRRARYMRWRPQRWDELAGRPAGSVGEAADRARCWGEPTKNVTPAFLQKLREIADSVEAGSPLTPLILLTGALDSEDRAVIDGCHRSTAYLMTVHPPARIPVYLGVGPEVSSRWWRWPWVRDTEPA